MANCSNSFEGSFNTRIHHLIRPHTSRPQRKSKQGLSPSTKPLAFARNDKHNRSLTKHVFNRHFDNCQEDISLVSKCPVQQDVESSENIREEPRKVLKNINQSRKAVRPSVQKKSQVNTTLLSINTKIKNPEPDLSQQNQSERDELTQRKKHSPSPSGLIKTKQIKSPKYSSINILHDTVRKRLMGYKIAQSKVLLNSDMEELRIEESILDQRDCLSNFTILKDFTTNNSFSEHLALEKQLGFLISLKKVATNNVQSISTEQMIYSILHQHPYILNIYQGILNGQSQYLFIRQQYQTHLKDLVLTCDDFKKYLKNILMIAHELSKKRVWYPGDLYGNLIISRNKCKLMNFGECVIQGSEWELRGRYKQIIFAIIETMMAQIKEQDSRNGKFKQFYTSFQNSWDFMQVITHKYLIETSRFYFI